MRDALTGAVTGLLIGWLFAVFTWFDPTIAKGWLIIDGLWFGTLVGVVMGLFMYWLTKSRRHLGSVSTMRPEFFDIAVDEDYADDAAPLLGGFPLPSRVGATPTSTAKSTPPTPASPQHGDLTPTRTCATGLTGRAACGRVEHPFIAASTVGVGQLAAAILVVALRLR